MKKQHLIFYVDSFLVGGIEKVLIEYLRNIDKTIFDVSLVIGFDMEELEELKPQIPEDVEIKYLLSKDVFCKYKKKKHLGKLNKLEKPYFESISFVRKALMKKRLLNLLKEDDIIVDFDMTLSPYAKEIKNPMVAFFHFSPMKYHRGIKRRQEKLGKRLANYDKVVVISDQMKDEAITLYPYLKDQIVRIYNSLNIENIKKRSLEITRNGDPLLKEKYMLAIGRLEETQKDFTTLIKAYALVADKLEEDLFIIGKGRHEDDLKNLAKELKIENRVNFLGFKSNPYPYIQNANLFVHSSKFEGLPTVLIEALVLEKILVATDCPTGPKEILDNSRNGILTTVGDEEELAQAFVKVLVDKENNEFYLNNIREHIKEFDSTIVIKSFESLVLNLEEEKRK